MGVMKLVEGGTEIEFDPSEGYRKPEDTAITRLESISGKGYSYRIYSKKRWVIPLEFIDKADAAQINDWWREVTELTFYPDLVFDASTSYTVRIRNAESTIESWRVVYWEDGINGVIEIREI